VRQFVARFVATWEELIPDTYRFEDLGDREQRGQAVQPEAAWFLLPRVSRWRGRGQATDLGCRPTAG
jgi:hypothetical protein